MLWQRSVTESVLATLRARFLDGLPPERLVDMDEAALVLGRVGDHSASLVGEERTAAASWGAARLAAFSSGRRVARAALGCLDMRSATVAVGMAGRRPVWPPGCVGGITHSARIAACVVGRRRAFAGLGIDVEPGGRVGDRVAGRVLSEAERAAVRGEDWETMLFSAKESVYKAVNPLTGEYLGFADVEVEATPDGRFRAATRAARPSSEWIARGRGFHLSYEGHWLTLFVIPAGA